MAHPNMPERRAYVKSILDSGKALDYKILSGLFKCSRSAISTDKKVILTGSGYKTRDVGIVSSQNQRAKRLGQNGVVSYEEWMSLCDKYDHKCAKCGQEILLTMDHIKPLSKGCLHRITNIQPLCRLCNLRKGNKILTE